MSSLLTNTSAMVALQTLRSINASLDQTNNRVSTGLRVNSAADNAAYWSIATTISSDNGALGAVQDSLGLAKASVDTANTGLDTVRESLQKIKELLVTASAPEADRTKVQTEIDSLLAGMQSTAAASVTSGSNWLSVDAAGEIKTVVASFSRTGGSVSLDTIDVALDGIALYTATGDAGLLDKTISVDGFTVTTAFAASVTLTDESFSFTVTQGTAHTVTIDAATATAALGTATIASANDLKLVIEQAFADAGVTGIDVTADGGDVTFSSADDFDIGIATEAAGGTGTVDAADMGLDAALAAAAGSITGAVEDIDISSATTLQVANALKIVDAALLEMTSASTELGALTQRIESQQNFVKALMDANTKAVGNLVDANMEEESTRLKALQTQQQLAVQSLSIANANSQNILLLFRN